MVAPLGVHKTCLPETAKRIFGVTQGDLGEGLRGNGKREKMMDLDLSLKREDGWPWEWCLREQETPFNRDKVTERFLRCVWQDQYLENIPLKTVDGHKIKVILPGWWNMEKGPDFSKAEVCLDDKIILKGDIEIDIDSNDWKGHGHHQDPAFNGVILHVVWQKGSKGHKIFNAADQEIIELELSQFLHEDIPRLLKIIEPDLYPYYCRGGQGHCSSAIRQENPQKMAYMLDLMGDERIVLKALRYEKELIKEGFDQLAYQGVMMALGYKTNQRTFLKLAKALPLTALKKILKGPSLKKNALRLQSLFLVTSGWIRLDNDRSAMEAWDAITLRYLRNIDRMWQEMKDLVPYTNPEDFGWRLSATRPANYPPRRLAGLAYFLAENLHKGLFAQLLSPIEALIKTLNQSSARHYSAILSSYQKLLSINHSDYWNYRFSLGGKPLDNPIQLIGPEKIKQIIINVIIPLVLIYARQNQDEQLEKILYRIYQNIPKMSDNSIIRFMGHRIFGQDQEWRALIHSAKRQHGLFQIFYDYCLEKNGDCKDCRFLSHITNTTTYTYV